MDDFKLKYLEWIFLRTILGCHAENDDENYELSMFASYSIDKNHYSLKKIHNRYVQLTKELLKDYKLFDDI